MFTELQHRLGYQFNDVSLLKLALTHRSVSARNNERLEFLGDSLLSWVVTQYLYRHLTEAREGQMSRLRSRLVKGETLAEVARALCLQPELILSDGELKTGGRDRASTLADAVESLIGAIYLDGGLEAASAAVHRWLGSRIIELNADTSAKDPKSELQEILQARQLPLPDYSVELTEGEGHAQVFHVRCSILLHSLSASASATSRKKAEKAAAKLVLNQLREKND
ncbi:ribonuclease III [Simiduia agarivorans]|uniref:Ribonuclease 3 n=1 Tax=Simiduia agarivorans (strain DSM 21679 / JCM 13881 / BCRC 17597 / SA1) TaxID=1117647 RepID=K4KFZ5_SIMAS|nr:ribonuclease III [Simiduia agarivorans]AFU97876.1 ribonuclease III [Simiduia agarivorans SA1 = DSM 21679]